MRRHLEDAVEHERAALEEDVAPVPTVVLHNMVRLSLDPQVEHDEEDAADPAAAASENTGAHGPLNDEPQGMHDGRQVGRDAEAREREHAVRQEVTARRHELLLQHQVLHDDALEEDDIDELAEEQPRVVLEGQVLTRELVNKRGQNAENARQTRSLRPFCPAAARESSCARGAGASGRASRGGGPA